MKALIMIDVQNDFMPGGSLEVKNGDKIVEVVNELQNRFDLIIATQDWHPRDHFSFASNHNGKNPFDVMDLNGNEQILWPDHCVQGKKGAEFYPDLHTNKVETIFRKGIDREIDSYSAFYDNNHEKSTGLSGFLREKGVRELVFCGLAADICVYFSIEDALKEGFSVTLIRSATKPLNEENFEKQIRSLKNRGTQFDIV